jgi:hypothetical protein
LYVLSTYSSLFRGVIGSEVEWLKFLFRLGV